MLKRFLVVSMLAAMVCVGTAGAATIETFDSQPVLGSSQASGVWYTDRYAPNGFQSVDFNGENVLMQSIDASDGAAHRPGGFGGAFYNTQGRKFDVYADFMSIDLYIPSQWVQFDKTTRHAGFWATSFNSSDAISLYPIIEFAGAGFNVYDNGTWQAIDIGAIEYDSWYNLAMQLSGGQVLFYIDNELVYSMNSNCTSYFGNAILQGYNTTAGRTYDIYWDNFTHEPIPEPATMTLLGLGMAGMVYRRLRKHA